MTTFDIGRTAEQAAAEFLEARGCEILIKNWRTRWCEIDIVAYRDRVIYFCEVKYRRTNKQGAGLDYITPRKLRQMQFAAEMWVQDYNWRGEHQLCAIEVSGPSFVVTAVVKDL